MSLRRTNLGLHSISAEMDTGVPNLSMAVNLASVCGTSHYAGMIFSQLIFRQGGLVVELLWPSFGFDIDELA